MSNFNSPILDCGTTSWVNPNARVCALHLRGVAQSDGTLYLCQAQLIAGLFNTREWYAGAFLASVTSTVAESGSMIPGDGSKCRPCDERRRLSRVSIEDCSLPSPLRQPVREDKSQIICSPCRLERVCGSNHLPRRNDATTSCLDRAHGFCRSALGVSH